MGKRRCGEADPSGNSALGSLSDDVEVLNNAGVDVGEASHNLLRSLDHLHDRCRIVGFKSLAIASGSMPSLQTLILNGNLNPAALIREQFIDEAPHNRHESGWNGAMEKL
jgi:hypothetical protein